MNQLQIFNFDSFKIRIIMESGKTWAVAKDVCAALEVDQSQTRRLDEDEKGLRSIQTPGGEQQILCVNEPGLYSLILGSRKPQAKEFKRWLTHEVIPAIRQTGMYATDELLANPDLLIAAATELKRERAERQRLELQVEADRPKIIFAEALETSGDSILIGELAKLLSQNGIDIGQNRLYAKLRAEGYLGRRGDYYNLPTQRSMNQKLFEIKTRTISSPGEHRTAKTTMVTGKGQSYFINKFKSAQFSAQ